jgi:lactoylglutathione lyase
MKLSHIAIACADVEKTARFYAEALGLREAFRMKRDDGSPSIIYFDSGPDNFIELLNRGGEPAPAAKTGLAHLCLEVENMDRELARLAKQGVKLDSPAKRGGDGNTQAWLSDPEGNRIELMQLAPEGLQMRYRKG